MFCLGYNDLVNARDHAMALRDVAAGVMTSSTLEGVFVPYGGGPRQAESLIGKLRQQEVFQALNGADLAGVQGG
jgi:hypothetical protein